MYAPVRLSTFKAHQQVIVKGWAMIGIVEAVVLLAIRLR